MQKMVHVIGPSAQPGLVNELAALCRMDLQQLAVELHLFDSEGRLPPLEADEEGVSVATLLDGLVASPSTKIVVLDHADESLLTKVRRGEQARKDILLIGVHRSTVSGQPQYVAGLQLLKRTSCNLVLSIAEDGHSMVIVPEESAYADGSDRQGTLRELVHMAWLRSQLTFTRSTVIAGEPVPWSDARVPANLRTVVDYCIAQGAYRPINGATAGHFAVRLSPTEFLTSRRREDFNHLPQVGLVRVVTDGPDSVIAYGSRPSVGGQSQRIIFTDHPGTCAIVHFHCEIRPGSSVPIISQREYECGSHQCGQNTSRGLKRFGALLAVHLDRHGPNIVFGPDASAEEVIRFIEENWDLSTKSGGYQLGQSL